MSRLGLTPPRLRRRIGRRTSGISGGSSQPTFASALTSHLRLDEGSGDAVCWVSDDTLTARNSPTGALAAPGGLGARGLTRASSMDFTKASNARWAVPQGKSYARAVAFLLTVTSNSEEFLFKKGGSTGGTYARKQNADANGRVEVGHTDAANTTTTVNTGAGTINVAGMWYFVAWGYDVRTGKVWVRCTNSSGAWISRVESAAGKLPAGADAAALYLGSEAGSNYFGGRLSNLWFWNDYSPSDEELESMVVLSGGQIRHFKRYPLDWHPLDMGESVEMLVTMHKYGLAAGTIFHAYDKTPNNAQPNFVPDGRPVFALHYQNGVRKLDGTAKLRCDGDTVLQYSKTPGDRPAYVLMDVDAAVSDKAAGDKDFVHQAPGASTMLLWWWLDDNETDQVLFDTCNWESSRDGCTLAVFSTKKMNFRVTRADHLDWGVEVQAAADVPEGRWTLLGWRTDGTTYDLCVDGVWENGLGTFSGARSAITAFSTGRYGNRASGSTYVVNGRLGGVMLCMTRKITDAEFQNFKHYKPPLVRCLSAVPALTHVWNIGETGNNDNDQGRIWGDTGKTVRLNDGDTVALVENTADPGTDDLSQSTGAAEPPLAQDTTFGGDSYLVLAPTGSHYLPANGVGTLCSGTDTAFCLFCVATRTGSGNRTLWSLGHSTGTGLMKAVVNNDGTITVTRTDDSGTSKNVTTVNAIRASGTGLATVIAFVFTGTALTVYFNDGAAEISAGDLNVGACTFDRFAFGTTLAGSTADGMNGSLQDMAFSLDLSAEEIQYVRDFLVQKHTVQAEGDPYTLFASVPQ